MSASLEKNNLTFSLLKLVAPAKFVDFEVAGLVDTLYQ